MAGRSRTARRRSSRATGRSGAEHRPEAVAAIDGFAAGRAERDLGVAAAVAAGGREHLAWAAITGAAVAARTVRAARAVAAVTRRGTAVSAGVTAATAVGRVPGGLAACPAAGAAARLGEVALGVEILLAGSEHEFLPTVGAGQVLVGVHENSSV